MFLNKILTFICILDYLKSPWNGVAGKNNYQLTGKEFENDFDLGWSDHGMRRYDPAMARWTSADPLMGVFADMSPYNYVMGNPFINQFAIQ
jgi:RHS repeat-associated protein